MLIRESYCLMNKGKNAQNFIKCMCIMVFMLAFFLTACNGGVANPLKDPNGSSKAELLADKSVVFSKESGFYDKEFELEMRINPDVISNASGVSIYYTTDGSDPAVSPTRKLYSAPLTVKDMRGTENNLSIIDPALITIDHMTVSDGEAVNTAELPESGDVDKCFAVRAVCVSDKGEAYNENQACYFIGNVNEHVAGASKSASEGWIFYIVNIQMDANDLFDHHTGIYVKGTQYEAAMKDYMDNGLSLEEMLAQVDPWTPANYNMRGIEWEKRAAINILSCSADGDVTEVTNQNCGVRIQGHASRSLLQKSFRLYARTDYGAPDFNFPYWGEALKNDEGESVDCFDTMILRSCFNGPAYMAKCEDAMLQEMLSDSGKIKTDFQKACPCVVYLNGEYWGVYMLTADYNTQYFEELHGLKKDNVVVYKMIEGDDPTLDSGRLPENVSDQMYYYRDLLHFFETVDGLEDDADYAEFCKLVDPDSFLDYFAAEVWLNNVDWPDGNWIMWRTIEKENDSYGDTRWRMALNDLDQCGSFDGEAGRNTIKDSFTQREEGLLAKDTPYIAVRVFAYLMTNEGFKQRYKEKLLDLSADTFGAENVDSYFKKYEQLMCDDLLEQHYLRYPSEGSVDLAREHFAKLRQFMADRPVYIWPMQDEL